AFLVIVIAAGFGATRLSFDQDLRNVFSGQIAAEARKIAAAQQFVDPEEETVILVEGKNIGDPAVFSKLQDFQFELQLIDNVDSVYSLFGLREPPDENGDAALLVKDPSIGLTPGLAAKIRAHPIPGAQLPPAAATGLDLFVARAAHATGLVFVVTPADKSDPIERPRRLRAEIESKASEILGGTGLSVTVTGFPTIRVAIVEVLKRDQLVLNGAGAVIGFIMSLIAFRSFTAAVMTAIP